MSLKKKIIKGGFYLAITNVTSQLIAIILNIFLARLLVPDDFGLIALTTTLIGFVTMVLSVGFGSSIIHFKDSTKNQISSIYFLNFPIAIFTFLIVYYFLPYVAVFYENSNLIHLIKWCSLSILITPFFITQLKLLERDMFFDKISIIIISSSFLSGILAVFSAYKGMGVFSLVIQSVSLVIFKMIFTLIIKRWSPEMYFNFSEIKHMVWYSIKYRISTGFLYFERNIDYLVLGKFFKSSTLGYYAFSYNIMYNPVKRISDLFQSVLFPSMSSIKNNKSQIIEIYLKSTRFIAIIVFPLMILVALNAEFLILNIFGEKWLPALEILQILCLAGAIQSVTQFSVVVLDSIGKPELSMYFSLFRTILTLFSIFFGAKYGINFVCYLLLFSKLICWLLVIFIIKSQIDFNLKILINYLQGVIVTILILFLSEYIILNFDFMHTLKFIKLLFQFILSSIVIWFFYSSILIKVFMLFLNYDNK